MKRVIAICRLSTAEQAAEGRMGLLRQRTDIQAAARLHGLEIVRSVEVIESGTKVRGQADFQRVFADLKAADIDGVVCSNLDRLVRPDRFEDFAVFDHFRLNRKLIFTPGEIVDPASQNGFLVSGVRGLLAGLERQLILQRTLAGKEECRKRGRHPGGPRTLPRGVTFDKRTGVWQYDPVESARVSSAFDLLLAGWSYRAIASKIGGGWTGTGIRSTLRNPLWIGIREFPPTAERKTPLPIRVIAESEALVPQAKFEAALDILQGRRQKWGESKREPRFLLSGGLLRCSCGKPHYIRCNARGERRQHHEYYYCSSSHPNFGPKCGARSMQREAVDATVERIVTEHLLDPELIASILEMNRVPTDAKPPANTEAALRKLEAKRERIRNNADEGLYDVAEAKRRLAAVDAEAHELRALLPEPEPQISEEELAQAIACLFAEFRHLEFEAKRDILRLAVREILVMNGAIPSIKLSGGFLGQISAKVFPRSRPP